MCISWKTHLRSSISSVLTPALTAWPAISSTSRANLQAAREKQPPLFNLKASDYSKNDKENKTSNKKPDSVATNLGEFQLFLREN
jgi:hypothetical protein